MILAALETWPFMSDVILVILGCSLILTLARLIIGPSLPDRVVALDLIGIITVGIIAVFSIKNQQPVYLIAAVVLALIAFIGTIAFAYFIARGGSS